MGTYHFYILQNREGTFYKGHTDNLQKRLLRHNQGRVPYTKNRGPWKLVYTESFPNRGLAMKREKQIKKWNRSRIIKLIQGNMPISNG
ncbi:MAG: GIY-YIG nuclease family protein [Candidatus Marinimicrobia bacterium]|nr:GIY-YIG nuclease family protein [Candidatus Neomarinimicrobiota bacterium]